MSTLASKCVQVNVSLKGPLKTLIRLRSGNPNHWANLKKIEKYTTRALKHFDEFYSSVYGKQWESIREALLDKQHKYVAVVNNYSDADRIKKDLENYGAVNVKSVYDAYKRHYQEKMAEKEKLKEKESRIRQFRLDKGLREIKLESLAPYKVFANSQEVESQDHEVKNLEEVEGSASFLESQEEHDVNDSEEVEDCAGSELKIENNVKTEKNEEDFPTVEGKESIRKPLAEVKLTSIEKDVEVLEDNTRIIKASEGMSSAMLYDFVPATEIKGMDDYLLESEHYNFYKKGANFEIEIEEEDELVFPEHLHMYAFPKGNFTRFPRSNRGSTDLIDYYVIDGASILPVLSLGLEPGDRVLDMCAAPGGKSVAILQTLLPSLLVANDEDTARSKRIKEFFKDVLLDTELLKKTYFVTKMDARAIADKEFYNKILVDVPCTTDRFALHSEENNLFKPSRVQERLSLPQVQSGILTNALKIVDLGGTVVYATCTLSPIQNDGVVQASLKQAFDENQVVFTIKNQTKALYPLAELFRFGNCGLKYGHLVVPTMANNWGPMYFCKMVRVE